MPIGTTYYGTSGQTGERSAAETFILETETRPKGQAGTEISFLYTIWPHQPSGCVGNGLEAGEKEWNSLKFLMLFLKNENLNFRLNGPSISPCFIACLFRDRIGQPKSGAETIQFQGRNP